MSTVISRTFYAVGVLGFAFTVLAASIPFTAGAVVGPDITQDIPETCLDATNLISNGSFEEPTVTNESNWQQFSSVPHWTLSADLELQRGWQGNVAAHGEQHAELAADELVTISQSVSVEEGAEYTVFWKFAARQNTDAEQNQLEVTVNGTQVGQSGPQAGGSDPLTTDDWTQDSATFTADGSTAEVAFAATGSDESIGTFIDDIVVCKTAEAPQTGSITIVKEVDLGKADFSTEPFSFSGNDHPTDGNDWMTSFSLEGGEHETFTDLPANMTYFFSEHLYGDEWQLTVMCDSGDVQTEGVMEADLQVNLQAGDEITCTFTNTYMEEVFMEETFEVCKVDTEGSPVPEWEMTITQTEGSMSKAFASLSIGGDSEDLKLHPDDVIFKGEVKAGITGENGCYTFTVPAGTSWRVTEEMQEDWSFTAVTSTGPSMKHEIEGEYCEFEAFPFKGRKLVALLEGDKITEEYTEEAEENNCTFTNLRPTTETEEASTSRRQSGNAANAQSIGTVAGAATSTQPQGEVLGEAVSQCGPLLGSYMRTGMENDEMEVYRLQAFLIATGHEGVEMTGEFDSATDQAVRIFQTTYREDILRPWYERGLISHMNPTGYVYLTTRWKINNLFCPDSEIFPELR